MKILIWLGVVLLVAIAAIVIYGSKKNRAARANSLQAQFAKGTVPQNLNGPYKGEAFGLLGSWQGKEINGTAQTGINIFAEGKRYPFKLLSARGRHDDIALTLIEYNIAGNPLWVRFIMDELVQVGEQKYVGKIHARVLPGFSIELGFFTLER